MSSSAASERDDILEKAFTTTVLELAAVGWLCFHASSQVDARVMDNSPQGNGDGGFLDLILVRCGKILFAELKAKKGLSATNKNLAPPSRPR